jgi:hypothetical protein
VLPFQAAHSDTSITLDGLVEIYVIHNTHREVWEVDNPGSYPGANFVSIANKHFCFSLNGYNPAD